MRTHFLKTQKKGLRIITLALVSTTILFTGCAEIDSLERTPEKLIPVLNESNSNDKLPEVFPTDGQDNPFNQSSIRFFGETENARFWVATNEDEDVCLIMELASKLDNTPSIGVSDCTSIEDFYQNGISLKGDADDVISRTAFLSPINVKPAEVSHGVQALDPVDSEQIIVLENQGNTLITMDSDLINQLGEIKIKSKSVNEIVFSSL